MDNVYRYGGLLYALIVVALIAAKLIGHLHRAWWIVLSPVWAPVVLIVIVALASIIGLGRASSRGENPFQ